MENDEDDKNSHSVDIDDAKSTTELKSNQELDMMRFNIESL